MLKRMSQESNTPITQIAQRIVTGGRSPLLEQPR